MSESNQTEPNVTYNEKYGFFEFQDGLKLPAVAIFYRYLSVYKDFIDIQLLYSLKSHQFVPAMITEVDDDDSDERYPPNIKLIYNIRLGEYVLFEIRAIKDFSIRIEAMLMEIYADSINDLLEHQDRLSYKTVDRASATIYYPQLSKLWGLEELTNLLINFTDGIFKKLDANGDYDFEIPKLFTRHGYTWKDIKQLVLRLRQPLDPDA